MGADGGGTNRWKSARERDRLRARFLVRSRVVERISRERLRLRRGGGGGGGGGERCISPSSGEGRGSTDDDDYDYDDEGTTTDDAIALLLPRYLRRIIDNDRSAFSIVAMARDGRQLDRTLPAATAMTTKSATTIMPPPSSSSSSSSSYDELLSIDVHWENDGGRFRNDDTRYYPQPTTLASSKYGREYVVERLVPYMTSCRLSMIEYASLLGRHGIVGMMLLGGLDPTVSDYDDDDRGRRDEDNDDSDDDDRHRRRRSEASMGAMELLHSLGKGGGEYDDGNGDGNGDGDGGGRVDASRAVPLSIWCYVVRAVIEMRMNGVLPEDDDDDDGRRREEEEEETTTSCCSACGARRRRRRGGAMLGFGPPCFHPLCEPCVWDHLVRRMPAFFPDLRRNVVTCPTCDAGFCGFKHCRDGDDDDVEASSRGEVGGRSGGHDGVGDGENDDGGLMAADVIDDNGRERRRSRSLARFLGLPGTSDELKSEGRRKVDRDRICGTWEMALRPAIETRQSRTVRSDRFFGAAISSPHLTAAYLEAGVDVNARNEYGQTPLYLACWRGSTSAVRSLLGYGADPGLASNGGSTCIDIASKCGRKEVLRELEGYAVTATDEAIARRRDRIPTDIANDRGKCQVSVLIDPSDDHPGAGACIVDDAVSEAQLEQLYRLWESLPVSECDEADGGKVKSPRSARSNGGERYVTDDGAVDISDKSAYRPSRHLFCDAEGVVSTMLEGCVEAARAALMPERRIESSSTNAADGRAEAPPSSVFQHIRFLNYERAGGVLPPHVDLCRVDHASGLRSTHTFILYLTDCEHGGGTALLKQLNDPKVIVVVRPRRGRALIFPHLCPHSGLEVISAPKLLLRSEVVLDLPSPTY